MAADGVERAVAFTQYPQFSCSTTGSSLNELWRAAERTGLAGCVRVEHHRPLAGARRVHRVDDRDGTRGAGAVRSRRPRPGAAPLQRPLAAARRDRPRRLLSPGDRRQRPGGGRAARRANPYLLAYQSEVGPVRWLGPTPSRCIRRLGARGQKHVLVVPIAFTSDHIETLSELDREYGEVARRGGHHPLQAHARRSTSGRGSWTRWPDIVREHLASRAGRTSSLYRTRCPGCVNPQCRQILNPVAAAAIAGRRRARQLAGSDAAGSALRSSCCRGSCTLTPPHRPAHRIEHPPHQPVGHLPHHLSLRAPTARRAAPAPRPLPAPPPGRPCRCSSASRGAAARPRKRLRRAGRAPRRAPARRRRARRPARRPRGSRAAADRRDRRAGPPGPRAPRAARSAAPTGPSSAAVAVGPPGRRGRELARPTRPAATPPVATNSRSAAASRAGSASQPCGVAPHAVASTAARSGCRFTSATREAPCRCSARRTPSAASPAPSTTTRRSPRPSVHVLRRQTPPRRS